MRPRVFWTVENPVPKNVIASKRLSLDSDTFTKMFVTRERIDTQILAAKNERILLRKIRNPKDAIISIEADVLQRLWT
jgi:hypothetical protein